MSIGAFKTDRFQGHRHKDIFLDNPETILYSGGSGQTHRFLSQEGVSGSVRYFTGLAFTDNVNGQPRTGPENNPASISSYICIKY
jgi:hypothetical protein